MVKECDGATGFKQEIADKTSVVQAEASTDKTAHSATHNVYPRKTRIAAALLAVVSVALASEVLAPNLGSRPDSPATNGLTIVRPPEATTSTMPPLHVIQSPQKTIFHQPMKG